MASVQSIERAFLVLDVVATAEMGVTEIANRVDLPKSTVARLLKTLEHVGAVERVGPDGHYRIGQAITGLAGGADAAGDLAARSRPHLRMLARDIGEDAGLSVPDGHRVHYIAQEDAENDVQVRDWTGTLLPMHVVPSGMVMLATWPEDRLAAFLDRDLDVFTRNTITDPAAIRERLDRVRADGYCWMKEEFAEGISSVGSAVYSDDNRVVGAIHVHGPSYRFPGGGDEGEIAALVTAAAERVSAPMS